MRACVLEGTRGGWVATAKREVTFKDGGPALTYGDGGDLGIEIQHSVAIHVDQVIASALFVIAEEVHSLCVLWEKTD